MRTTTRSPNLLSRALPLPCSLYLSIYLSIRLSLWRLSVRLSTLSVRPSVCSRLSSNKQYGENCVRSARIFFFFSSTRVQTRGKRLMRYFQRCKSQFARVSRDVISMIASISEAEINRKACVAIGLIRVSWDIQCQLINLRYVESGTIKDRMTWKKFSKVFEQS